MKTLKSLGVKITHATSYLPEGLVTNQEIIERHQLRLKDDWVRANIGIESRHWCQNKESASDLGAKAFDSLLKYTGATPDALIVSTVSQDLMTPSTAAIIQSLVTPGSTYPAFDITAACSGLMFALDIGRRFVMTGYEAVACVATEIRSYYLDKSDRRTVMLFGDGAAALLLKKTKENEVGLIYTKTFTDGRYWDAIVVGGNGSRQHKESLRNTIEMRNAQLITQSAVSDIAAIARTAVAEAGLEISDINFFVFHQANGQILGKVVEGLGLREDQYLSNFRTCGNMTSASVGVALSDAVEQKKIHGGDLVLMIAVGGGFTAGVAIFRWEEK